MSENEISGSSLVSSVEYVEPGVTPPKASYVTVKVTVGSNFLGMREEPKSSPA